MSSITTYKVCSHCFEETKDLSNPIRSIENRNRVCPTCKDVWDCISVAYSHQDKKWYQIRERTLKSKSNICSAIASKKKCPKGQSCVHAHNHLEKAAWNSEKGERLMNKPKFYCYVCKLNFDSSKDVGIHMHSIEHSRTTDKMKLLPNAGSSCPIRERPNLSIYTAEHLMCEEIAKGKRCISHNACEYAHSEEELAAWNEALEAEKMRGEDELVGSTLEDKYWGQEGDMREDASYRIPKQPELSSPTTPTRKKPKEKNQRPNTQDLTSAGRNLAPFSSNKTSVNYIPESITNLRRFIAKNKMRNILKKQPTHINLQCDSPSEMTIGIQSKEERKWVFRFTSCQEEQIRAIILYNHKNKFRIGQMTHGESYRHKRQLQTKLYDNQTGCQIDHDIGKDMYLEVPVIFKPHEGEYKVYLVFQLLMAEVVAFRLHVKVLDENFNASNKFYDDWIDKQVESIPTIIPRRSVIWEQYFKIIPFPDTADSKRAILKGHEVPTKIETMIAAGVYSKMGQEISPNNYKKRFHDLLFLEEFEHKRRLCKYDLNDYVINFETAKKMLMYYHKDGCNLSRAPANFRYITFKLQHSLFEGYRSYKPPSQVFVIPKGFNEAYECRYVGRGGDEIHCMITESMVEECEKRGGLAQVRFAPDRNDYVRMHEALCRMDLDVVFPKFKKAPISWHWEEKSILDKAVYEKLSRSQMEGLMRIINTQFQTFPTLICGPFGCGKTYILAVAAKLIGLYFYGSTVLIVAKNNSCANLFVEVLENSGQFDSISSYKSKLHYRVADIRPILFRHFAKNKRLIDNELKYTKYSKSHEKDAEFVFESLTLEELLICGIVVTTTQGCYTLIKLKDKLDKPDLFSHIFIDEATQIIEPEACIPLQLGHPNTKVVLAGDLNQTRPLVLSETARTHGLDRTLLERFYDLQEYETEQLAGCRVELRENFRSQEPIVRFLSKLFYNDSLTANPPKVKGPGNFPCMSMVHVDGEEERRGVDGFFSFANRTECGQTIKVLKRFVRAGVDPDDIKVMSTYRGQMNLVEGYLKSERVDGPRNKCSHQNDYTGTLCRKFNCINDKTITCGRLGKIKECDVLIINTVRTIHDAPTDNTFESHLDLGLLDDLAQFNTILSRARGWVMVIGDTECLTSVGRCSDMWRQYIEACKELGGYFPDGNIADEQHDNLFQGSGKQWENIVSDQVKEKCKSQAVEILQQPITAAVRVNKAKERIERKTTLLEGFISTCKEELEDSGTLHTISAISVQILLAESALLQIEKQSQNSSIPTEPTPSIPPTPTPSRTQEQTDNVQERGATSNSYSGSARP